MWKNPYVPVGCGICLILVGIVFDSSVFLGNPTPLDWIFDSLAVFFIIRGLWDIFTKK